MRRYYFTHFCFIPTNNDTTTANTPATFTQEQVDALLNEKTTAIKKERDQTVSQLEALKKNQSLSVKEKGDLQAQIDQLQSLNLSKEEIARQETERLKKTYDEEKTSLTAERDRWKGEHEGYRIRAEILSAANEAGAYNSDQMVQMLFKDTKLVEQKVTVNGQEQLQYSPIVKFADKDKDGKPVVLDLSVKDVLKRMKELPEMFGNLFKSDAKGGTGLMNQGQGAQKNSGFRPGMSMDEYQKFRKERGFGSKVK